MLTLKAKLFGIFKANDFKDKTSGEVTTGKTKLQLLTTRKMVDGSEKQELLDISIPDSRVDQYKSKVGQIVDVQVGVIGKVTYYGI